jgi:hypothetical protein
MDSDSDEPMGSASAGAGAAPANGRHATPGDDEIIYLISEEEEEDDEEEEEEEEEPAGADDADDGDEGDEGDDGDDADDGDDGDDADDADDADDVAPAGADGDEDGVSMQLQVSPRLVALLPQLEEAHDAVKAAPLDAAAAQRRAGLLRRLGVTDSSDRPNFDTQVDAVLLVVRAFLLGDDSCGLVVMPCGTGKSLVARWVMEAHMRFAGATDLLVLVPSLSLVAQFLSGYAERAPEAGGVPLSEWEVIIVCSDARVVDGHAQPAAGAAAGASAAGAAVEASSALDDEFSVSQVAAAAGGVFADLKVATSSSDETLAALLRPRADRKRVRLVVTTYHSTPRIEEAQRQLLEERTPHIFQLAVFDEAHHTATASDGLMATALHPSRVCIARRLFITATPRMRGAPPQDGEDGAAAEKVRSMDNRRLYGRYVLQRMCGCPATCCPALYMH